MPGNNQKYKAIVVGASAGGLYAISYIVEKLPQRYPLPIIVVQHRAKDQKDLLEEVLQSKSRIRIKQADEKESIESNIVYIAPPDYHLLIEKDETFSLSSDVPVHFSRPSINVLFETAAKVFTNTLIGIILTGASSDGAAGIVAVKNHGGLTIAQDPVEAQFPFMPTASIETKEVQHIWILPEIQNFLLKIMDN